MSDENEQSTATPIKTPDVATARKMAEIAREAEGFDKLAEYLDGLVAFLEGIAGSVFIGDLNPGDEVTVCRKHTTVLVVPEATR